MSVSRDPILEPTDGDEAEPGAPAAPGGPSESKELSEYKAALEELVTCNLSTSIFYDPVRLPSSNHVVERDFARQLTKDPYTKKPFVYSDDMPTDTRIKKAVDAYLALNKSAVNKQYGYAERQLLKEAEERRKAQALLDATIHDKDFAYSLMEDDKQQPQQDANRPAENYVNVNANHAQPIEGDPVERARVLRENVISYLDNFTDNLDAEIKDLPHFSQYRVLWVMHCILFSGMMTCLTLWLLSRQESDSLVDRMASTPSADGSPTFCDSWLDATDVVLPCFHFNAMGELITAVCQSQCDAVSEVIENTIYEHIFLMVSLAGCLITTLGLLSTTGSVRPGYGYTVRAFHFKNPERYPLHDFSFALREQGHQLFRQVNVYREGDEERLSGDVSVGEIKMVLRRLRGRISGGNVLELAPVPEEEIEGRADNVGDPENPVSPQILFQMIKVFLDQLDHKSLRHRSRVILAIGLSAITALIWSACTMSDNEAIINNFYHMPLLPGSEDTCRSYLGLINTPAPCKQPDDKPIIPRVCEALCHVLSRSNVDFYTDLSTMVVSAIGTFLFLCGGICDNVDLLDLNRLFNRKLPASLYDSADTLFRHVNFQPDVQLTRESKVNDIRNTLNALQGRLIGGI